MLGWVLRALWVTEVLCGVGWTPRDPAAALDGSSRGWEAV